MPLYEYHCDGCDQTVEVLVRSQADRPSCPECGGDSLHKELSVPASPAVRGGQSLPVSRAGSGGESCAAPRCCGGGCQF